MKLEDRKEKTLGGEEEPQLAEKSVNLQRGTLQSVK